MKNLFISMGSGISVRNFTDGPLIYRKLEASDIAALVEETRAAGGEVRAYFDFGSVPSEKKKRNFRELLASFEKITGVQLTADDFTAKESPEGETLPNVNFIPTVTDDMRMLAVEYFFSVREGAEDFLERFEVSDHSMNFHLFERGTSFDLKRPIEAFEEAKAEARDPDFKRT